jgi:hypothetical protein
MKRLAFLLTVVFCAGLVFVVSATEASAVLVPCCEGGFKPNKSCNNDNNCPGACIGGSKDGRKCNDSGDCPATCVGGSKDGQSCFTSFECPGGTCDGNAGTCDAGSCTALCERGKPKETPDDPISEMLNLPATDLDLELPAPAAQPCP